jgi:catechol 2,3-dioxygenase-like lactoylglutathione lyase family enzyme
VDRVLGLKDVGAEITMPANTTGLRHVSFQVDDIDAALAGARDHGAELVGEVERYGDIYRLCYLRGPEGIIVELAEQLG